MRVDRRGCAVSGNGAQNTEVPKPEIPKPGTVLPGTVLPTFSPKGSRHWFAGGDACCTDPTDTACHQLWRWFED